MKGRLWIVARSLPAHVAGGMERIAFDTCAGLAARGWSVDLATTHIGRESGLPPAVRVHALGAPPGVHSIRFRRALARWAAGRERPDLVLSISFAAGPVVRTLPGIPAICQMHGSAWREFTGKIRRLDPRGLYRLWLHFDQERRTLPLYDRIVAVGPAVRGYLGSFPYGFLKDARIEEIPNGIDAESCARAASIDREEARARLGVSPSGK
ncbi:MAG: glycosyltransferase family 4 protein, partial [Candidatus Eisenbacteria bacterium]